MKRSACCASCSARTRHPSTGGSTPATRRRGAARRRSHDPAAVDLQLGIDRRDPPSRRTRRRLARLRVQQHPGRVQAHARPARRGRATGGHVPERHSDDVAVRHRSTKRRGSRLRRRPGARCSTDPPTSCAARGLPIGSAEQCAERISAYARRRRATNLPLAARRRSRTTHCLPHPGHAAPTHHHLTTTCKRAPVKVRPAPKHRHLRCGPRGREPGSGARSGPPCPWPGRLCRRRDCHAPARALGPVRRACPGAVPRRRWGVGYARPTSSSSPVTGRGSVAS